MLYVECAALLPRPTTDFFSPLHRLPTVGYRVHIHHIGIGSGDFSGWELGSRMMPGPSPGEPPPRPPGPGKAVAMRGYRPPTGYILYIIICGVGFEVSLVLSSWCL
jgi:hypothetical protein